jgi:hypothetical protein
MIYYLLRPDGLQVPVFVIDQDAQSIKVQNIDGYTRWIKYTDFTIKDNLVILKN